MLLRPELEYASPIWNPHTTTQIKDLEKVQYWAARFVKIDHRRQTITTDLIATLGWPTLERRRIIKKAIIFYQIVNNIINITLPPGLLKPLENRGITWPPGAASTLQCSSFTSEQFASGI